MTQFTEDLGCFQIQCQVLTLTLALEERQYLRYPPGTIINGVNVGGQFAVDKKSGDTRSKPIKQSNIDPESGIGATIQFLKTAFDRDKTLEKKVNATTKEITKNITGKYGIPTSISDAGNSFLETIKKAATEYNLIEKKIPKAEQPEKLDLLKSLVRASIPLAVAVSLTVGAELAIGLFLGQTVGEILFGSAVALGVGAGVDKGLDLAKIDNPIIRGMTQLAAGVATGGVITKAFTQIAKAKSLTETAKQFIEQAASVPGIRRKVGDVHKLITVLEKDKIDSQQVLDALYREVTQDKRLGRIMGAPHSFSERLQEYASLSIASDKTGKGIGLEWRKGIIDAEIKYGEAIEKVHAVPMKDVFSSKVEKIYHDFLSIAKKGKTGSANVEKLTKEGISNEGRLTKNGNTLITSDGTRVVFDGKRKYQGVEINIGERVDAVQSTVQEVGSLSNVDIGKIYVGHFEGKNRDATRGFTVNIGAGNFIGIGFMHDARTLGFHETGHLIEDTTNLAKTSIDYIASRKTTRSTQNIDNSEVAITDFLDQYTGKIYTNSEKDSATEVVSMGVQGLAHFQNLHRAVRDDIDHLRYTLFALEKTIGV